MTQPIGHVHKARDRDRTNKKRVRKSLRSPPALRRLFSLHRYHEAARTVSLERINPGAGINRYSDSRPASSSRSSLAGSARLPSVPTARVLQPHALPFPHGAVGRRALELGLSERPTTKSLNLASSCTLAQNASEHDRVLLVQRMCLCVYFSLFMGLLPDKGWNTVKSPVLSPVSPLL